MSVLRLRACQTVKLCFGRVLTFSTCAEDPLVGSIAKQLLDDKDEHDKTAAEWTKRFAQG